MLEEGDWGGCREPWGGWGGVRVEVPEGGGRVAGKVLEKGNGGISVGVGSWRGL